MTTKLKKSKYLSYAFPQISNQIQLMSVATFFMYFLTDMVGLSVASVTLMLFVARVWDSANDPAIGLFIDEKVKFGKNGKFRPLMLWAGILGAVFFALSFTYFNFAGNGNIIYLYIVHIISSIFGTVSGIAYPALAGNLTSDPQQRTVLSTFKTFGGIIGGMLATVGTMPLVKLIGQGNDAQGMTIVMWIYTLICIIFIVIAYKNITEKKIETVTKTVKESLFKQLANVFRNKAFVYTMILSVAGLLAANIRQSVAMYFFDNVVGNVMIVGIITAISMSIMMVFAGFVPMITKRIGKKGAIITAMVINILVSLVIFVFKTNVPVILAMSATMGIAVALGNISSFSLQVDTIDYHEWKTGKRSEGTIFSIYGLMIKFGSALSPVITGLVLTVSGYTAGAVTETAIKGIEFGYLWLPILFYVISLIAIIANPLSEKKLLEIQEAIKAKKSQQIDQ